MNLDILLVNPLFLAHDPEEGRLMTPYFPLGLLYLAAALRDAGYQVAIWDGMFREGPADLVATLVAQQPRVVGLGVLSTVRTSALELAALAKAHGAQVVVGGADPTARPASYLARRVGDAWSVDAVVVGEGEETLRELLPLLLRGAPPEDWDVVAGLAYRARDGQVRHTPPRPLRRDLDALPFPARDLIDVPAYLRAWRARHGYASLSLIASRGCPYDCAWCQKCVFGRSYRPRAPESVAEEMALLKTRYAPDQLRIVDDVLGIDRRWLRRWRDAVLARDAVIPFECLSRVDLVDREALGWLKEAGCVRIAFGAESGSQRVLDAMAKGTRVAQIRAAAALCHALGIEVYFYLMVGYPPEEWADIAATVRLLRETLPDAFSATVAYPLPGTPFHAQVQDRLLATPDWDYTAENRLLYRGRYSPRFYRWVRRLLHAEWESERLRRGVVRASGRRRLRAVAALWVARAVVHLLRLPSVAARTAPSWSPGH